MTTWFSRPDTSPRPRGSTRVLIIREKGSKLPADLGGDIYAALADRSDITPIKDTIRKFVEHRL